MEIRQREIWLANLNPSKGSEPGKIRPVVILQTDDLNPIHPSTVVCPITSNVIHASELLRVHLHPGETGLEVDSDVLIDQVRAIDRARLLQHVGMIDEQSHDRIKANLQLLLNIE